MGRSRIVLNLGHNKMIRHGAAATFRTVQHTFCLMYRGDVKMIRECLLMCLPTVGVTELRQWINNIVNEIQTVPFSPSGRRSAREYRVPLQKTMIMFRISIRPKGLSTQRFAPRSDNEGLPHVLIADTKRMIDRHLKRFESLISPLPIGTTSARRVSRIIC
jgi:hypothetical protein